VLKFQVDRASTCFVVKFRRTFVIEWSGLMAKANIHDVIAVVY